MAYLVHHGVKGMKWGVRRKKLKEYKRLYAKGNSELVTTGFHTARKASQNIVKYLTL